LFLPVENAIHIVTVPCDIIYICVPSFQGTTRMLALDKTFFIFFFKVESVVVILNEDV